MDLQWDGSSAAGEGNLTAELAGGLGSRELAVNWQSVCVSSPKGSIEEYAAQILTVTFHPVGQPAGQETSGFAVSFNSAGYPQFLRLVNSPIELSDEEGCFEEWLYPMDSTKMQQQQQQLSEEQTRVDLEAELKQLEQLKQQAERLDAMIQQKDREIRTHLLSDCTFMSAQLKHCRDLKCFIGTSFKIVPDLFRLMKYKFGPLPSSLSGNLCQPSTDATQGQNSTTDISPPKWNTTTGTTDLFNVSTTTPLPGGLPDVSVPTPGILNDGVRKTIHHTAVVLLTLAVAVLLIKICRNTMTWKRKRADFAARREEVRTRRAYRRAACRYQWKLWWQNLFRQQREPQHSRLSQHNLSHRETRRTMDFENDSDSATEDGMNNMGAEILGLRRVLEYVGNLVGINDVEDSDYFHDPQELGGLYTRAAPAPSSTAPLTTIGSPRTSSVLSYETSILDSVDSLEIETATMVSG